MCSSDLVIFTSFPKDEVTRDALKRGMLQIRGLPKDPLTIEIGTLDRFYTPFCTVFCIFTSSIWLFLDTKIIWKCKKTC